MLFCLPVHVAAAHKTDRLVTLNKSITSQTCTQKSATLSRSKFLPALREFDKLRFFKSYDPATDRWSTIEDFETVDILEDTTEKRKEQYIYHSFWAYDKEKDSWHKVDIRDYGYKLRAMSAAAKTEEDLAMTRQKSFRFWENWNIGLSVGGGPTFHNVETKKIIVKERDGTFFLQTLQSEKNKVSYKINWLGASYTQCGDPRDGALGALNIGNLKDDALLVFKGRGWNIPVTLFTHYTLFKRFRVGAGVEVEINCLKSLKPQQSTSHLNLYKVPSDHQM